MKPSLNVHSSKNACLGKDQVDLHSQYTCYMLDIVYSSLCNPQTRTMLHLEKCGNGHKGLVISRHFSTVDLEVANWNQSQGRPDHVTQDFPPHPPSSKSLQPSPLPEAQGCGMGQVATSLCHWSSEKGGTQRTLIASPVPTLLNFTLFYTGALGIWPLIIKMLNDIPTPCLGWLHLPQRRHSLPRFSETCPCVWMFGNSFCKQKEASNNLHSAGNQFSFFIWLWAFLCCQARMCWEILGSSAREGYPTSEDGGGFRVEERGIETARKSRIPSTILTVIPVSVSCASLILQGALMCRS